MVAHLRYDAPITMILNISSDTKGPGTWMMNNDLSLKVFGV